MAARITYYEYKRLGYSVIPAKQFERFAVMAQQAVRKFSNRNSFSDEQLFGAGAGDNILRGIFEICEVYYSDAQSDRRLAGFTNEGYREQYFNDAHKSVNKRVFELIRLYFPREQLFRGM